MTSQDWKELERLSNRILCEDVTPYEKAGYYGLIESTRELDEHPEDYEGPCLLSRYHRQDHLGPVLDPKNMFARFRNWHICDLYPLGSIQG